MVGSFCISLLIMFSCISHRINAVKQVISREEAAIGLASVSSKSKAKNSESSNSIEKPKKEG